MNGWLWALIVFLIVVTWLPAGVVGDRIFNFVHGVNIHSKKDSREGLGLIWLFHAFVGLFLKFIFVFSYVVVVSIVNFVVDIPSGGFPRWFKSQRKLANSLRKGLIR